MLSKTTLSALRTLVLIGRQPERECWSPRRLAESLGESPAYWAKVARLLVRTGILQADKGAKGGVRLAKAPAAVQLRDIVEACEGPLVNVPANAGPATEAARELRGAVSGVLERWTLAALLEEQRRPQS